MAGVNMPNVEGLGTVDELKNAVAKMTKELSWLLNNLDTRNMNYIDGDVVVDGTITAAKMLVQELSAITANLGHIISGLIESVEIYGSYIATRNGEFPRAEMSSEQNLFGAYTDANRNVLIEAISVPTGSPRVILNGIGGSLWFYQQSTASIVNAYNSELRIQASKDINLEPGYFYNVYVPFDQLRDRRDSISLDGKLSQKATSGASTGLSGSANGGIPIGTQFKDVDGRVHTWMGVPSHSHPQT